MWHGSQCSYDNRNRFCFHSPHPDYFYLFLWLSGVFLHRHGYFDQLTPFFRIMPEDDIRFVVRISCVSVDLLIIQNRAWTHCRNQGCIIPRLVHPFRIHDRYSSGVIYRFYCDSLGIHVLPISYNRKLNDRLFMLAIDKFVTYRHGGLWESPSLSYGSAMPDLGQLLQTLLFQFSTP
mgnify:CR=1 FL=1